MLDSFEYLTLKDKLAFFEDGQLFRKYKFCLQYTGMKDSIDEEDFDSGLKNEDSWSSPYSGIYGCSLSLFSRQGHRGEEIEFPGFGKWVTGKPIKSLKTGGSCCFRIEKGNGKVLTYPKNTELPLFRPIRKWRISKNTKC